MESKLYSAFSYNLVSIVTLIAQPNLVIGKSDINTFLYHVFRYEFEAFLPFSNAKISCYDAHFKLQQF